METLTEQSSLIWAIQVELEETDANLDMNKVLQMYTIGF
jgi:hypothetical protein